MFLLIVCCGNTRIVCRYVDYVNCRHVHYLYGYRLSLLRGKIVHVHGVFVL